MVKQLVGFLLPVEEVEKWAARINPDWRAKHPNPVMAGFICANQKVIHDHGTTLDGGPYLHLVSDPSSSSLPLDDAIIIYVTQGCHWSRKVHFEKGEVESRAWAYLEEEEVDMTKVCFWSVIDVHDDLMYRRTAYHSCTTAVAGG